MGEVRPLPSPGDVFTDVRGEDRTMRVSYHADRGVVVVSLWVGGLCRGSFRLAEGEVGRLIDLLEATRLAAAYAPPLPASDPAPASDPVPEAGPASRPRPQVA
jgi:hypothetical protein